MKAAIIFTGSGPILVLTTFESLESPEFIKRLGARGIPKFIAHEVGVDKVRKQYGTRYSVIEGDLSQSNDLRVMDIDGHHVFNNFSFEDMGTPVYFPSTKRAAGEPVAEPQRPSEEGAGAEWLYVQLDEYGKLVDSSYLPMIGSRIAPSIPVGSGAAPTKARFQIDGHGIIFNGSPQVVNGHQVVLHGRSSPPLGRTDAVAPTCTWRSDPVAGWT